MNSDNILVYNLYNSRVDACNTGTNNWAKGVKKLLDNYGFSCVWSNQQTINLKLSICNSNKELLMCLKMLV